MQDYFFFVYLQVVTWQDVVLSADVNRNKRLKKIWEEKLLHHL